MYDIWYYRKTTTVGTGAFVLGWPFIDRYSATSFPPVFPSTSSAVAAHLRWQPSFYLETDTLLKTNMLTKFYSTQFTLRHQFTASPPPPGCRSERRTTPPNTTRAPHIHNNYTKSTQQARRVSRGATATHIEVCPYVVIFVKNILLIYKQLLVYRYSYLCMYYLLFIFILSLFNWKTTSTSKIKIKTIKTWAIVRNGCWTHRFQWLLFQPPL
jgi:hypothetical protein